MARLDERLRTDLERVARPADPSGIYEHLIRRRERRRVVRRVQAGVLAFAVFIGGVAGLLGLSGLLSDEGTGTTPGNEPSPTMTPEPSPPPVPAGASDMGLGYVVCDLATIEGPFLPSGGIQLAMVGHEIVDGACPELSDPMRGVVGIDFDRDGRAEAAQPITCTFGCSIYGTTDVDADGTDELYVQNVQFSIAGLMLFDFGTGPDPEGGETGVFGATVPFPADPEHGFEPDVPLQLWQGGDAFELETLTCEDRTEGRVLVVSTATQEQPDSPGALWSVHETVLRLTQVGVLDIVSSRDYQEPVSEIPSFASDGPACAPTSGANPGALEDGRHFVYLSGLDVAAGILTVDPATFLTGEEANREAAERGDEVPVPNDYYIVNDDDATATLVLSPEVELVLLDWNHCCDETFAGSPETLAEAIDSGADLEVNGYLYRPTSPYWVTVLDGVVERIEEQYLP